METLTLLLFPTSGTMGREKKISNSRYDGTQTGQTGFYYHGLVSMLPWIFHVMLSVKD